MEQGLDVPSEWEQLTARLESGAWRRLVVLGAPDVGKSTFCRFLLGRFAGAILIDSDLGQKIIGPPACVTSGTSPGNGALRPDRFYFVGEMNPVGHQAAVVAGLARLAGASDRPTIVNTSGLVSGPGIPLKRAKIDALGPDQIVAIQRTQELEPILASLPQNRVHRMRPSQWANRKGSGLRRRSRESNLADALGPIEPNSAPDAVAEDLMRNPPPAEAIRLCAVAGPDGADFALGLIRLDRFFADHLVWLSGRPCRIHRIRVGIEAPPGLIASLPSASFLLAGKHYPADRSVNEAPNQTGSEEMQMSDDRPEGGTNSRSLKDTVAGTGPGIPDDARGPGEEIPEPPSDEEVERTAERMKEKGKGRKG